MTSFRRLSVLTLLAVWLAATHHCGLEGAGLWHGLSGDASAACCTDTPACADDGCELVEGGAFRDSAAAVKVLPPSLHVAVLALCGEAWDPGLLEVLSIDCAVATARPKEWVPTWHIERRAAPPSRAPAIELA